jgi:biotin transport system substrate-specific component
VRSKIASDARGLRLHNPTRLKYFLLSSLFAALTAAGAFIKIPLPVVPITLQTFFVMLSGSLLGSKFGALSQVIYLAVGLCGPLVFAYGGGPAYIFQPTFGYLLSYPIAAFVIGYLIERRRERPSLAYLCASNALGVLLILTIGAIVLFFNLKFIVQKPISLAMLVTTYYLAFLPGDAIKIFACAITARKLFGFVTQH